MKPADNEALAFQALATQLLPSIMQQLEQESSQPIETVVRLVKNGQEIQRIDLPSSPCEGTPGLADLRALIQPKFIPAKFRFAAQAIIRGVAEGTGYSGFSIRGTISLTESSCHLSARSNRYNVWRWEKPFEIQSS